MHKEMRSRTTDPPIFRSKVQRANYYITTDITPAAIANRQEVKPNYFDALSWKTSTVMDLITVFEAILTSKETRLEITVLVWKSDVK